MTLETDVDRRLTRSERVRVALFLAIILGICWLCSCATLSAPSLERRPVDQYTSAVSIKVSCIGQNSAGAYFKLHRGSGVLVTDSLVVTAAHVASCENGEQIFAMTVNAPGSDDEFTAEVDALYLKQDLARVRLMFKRFEGVRPIHIGPLPGLGEVVCAATAVPMWTYRCDRVQPPIGNDSSNSFVFGGMTSFGNSGSGVYDSQGRLVGIVVTAFMCQGQFPCLGGITPLQGLEGLVRSNER